MITKKANLIRVLKNVNFTKNEPISIVHFLTNRCKKFQVFINDFIFKRKKQSIYLNLFNDYGIVWGNKTTPTNSEESIRSSYGFGIKFYSPVGPVGFSWAFPIQSESYDIERMFLFTVGNLN